MPDVSNKKNREVRPGPTRPIARRFVIYIVLLSSLITLITTAAQLYFDYQRDISAIEMHIEQIRNSHLKSISNSVWVEDEQQINSQLDGLVRYSDMELLSISLDGKTQWQAGETRSKRIIKKQIPLLRNYRGKSIKIGELHIVASIDSVLERLIDKAIVILISNGLKTFIVAGFMFLLFHYFVARHLYRLAEWARSFNIAIKPDPVTLDRNKQAGEKNVDEFDEVAGAINEMLRNIQRSYGELKESHNSLEKQAIKNQEILNLHLEKTPLAAITWDRDFKCAEWNKSAERIFGFTREEAIGKYAQELIVPNELRDDLEDLFDALLNQKGGSHNINENVTKDGEIILCEWFNTPIKSDDGVPIAVASLAQDITVQHQNREELIEARQEAEKANKSKSDFLSKMSHELRTPLNAILGFGQLLEMVLHDEMQKNNAMEITKAGKHLLELINDILDLSRIETGRLDLSLQDVHLKAVINECIALIQPLANSRNVQLIDETSAQTDFVLRVDYTRCKQVLLNLLSNAVKYNREHGDVVISCDREVDDLLRINIMDTGPGIAEDKMSQLFEPFNRLGAELGDVEGTGIGLVITKQLVELMGGRLGVDSSPGVGSIFWVELKTAAADKKYAEIRNNEELMLSATADEVPAGHIRILVAEDNETNQEVLRQQLNLLGYSVDFANNGIEAFESWRNGDYHLLMTDIHMPVMDGYELVGNMQKTKQYAENRIPVIAITADAMHGHAQQCIDAGMDDYVSKPVHIEELQRVLKKWLPKQANVTPENNENSSIQLDTDMRVESTESCAEGPIDRSMLTRMIGDDVSSHLRVLHSFVRSTPGMLDEIKAAISGHDAESLVLQAHKLKSSARSVGANEMANTCESMEKLAREKQWAEIEALVPKLDGLFEVVEDYVEENFT